LEGNHFLIGNGEVIVGVMKEIRIIEECSSADDIKCDFGHCEVLNISPEEG
jgi:hypothetical protein